MLDSGRLRLLVALADTGSIAGAAQTVGCSAAAASQQLAVLERESGVSLLERGARSVRLSHAGQVLAEHGRRILDDLAAAEQAVVAAGSPNHGRVRVASFASGARRLVGPVIASLRRRSPDLDITFTEMEPEEAVPALRSGDIDLALTHQYAGFAAPDLRGLQQTFLLSDPLALAVPTHGAQTGDVDLLDFAQDGWISGRSGHGFQALTEMVTGLCGFEPRITARADTYALVLDLVAAGLGVALVPRGAVAAPRGVVLLGVCSPADLVRAVHVTRRSGDWAAATLAFERELVRRAGRVPAGILNHVGCGGCNSHAHRQEGNRRSGAPITRLCLLQPRRRAGR
ncbi:LysR family transcriptional regulator [Kineosporia sp. NBRC 101677]|uniref:LysR substrate-binding domain-containing protein n=1 Tax=Kineosporia TaxID=49184 RepID=UPI0024A2BDB8|nr:LysR substrate-binding domain-containing protein [Kineosporia sp. NBRC 101677]GLY18790.1 LysR family transcriptional regulator [Kineosporia sp. NBRC 101677]